MSSALSQFEARSQAPQAVTGEIRPEFMAEKECIDRPVPECRSPDPPEGGIDKGHIKVSVMGDYDRFPDKVNNPVGHISKGGGDRKSTRLNSSHTDISRMPSSA